MNLMVPPTWDEYDFILFLSAFPPDCLDPNKYVKSKYLTWKLEVMKMLRKARMQISL